MLILLFLLLFFSALSDAICAKIPNVLILIGLIGSMVLRIYFRETDRMLRGMVLAAIIFSILYIFFQIGLIGAGDIKILMMMSMYLDVSNLLYILFISFGSYLPFHVVYTSYPYQKVPQKRGIRMSIPLFLGYGLWYLTTVL